MTRAVWQPTSRCATADIVKGIAILLVVIGHELQGMLSRQWIDRHWGGAAVGFIYSFHMPAFFFAAGLFLPGSFARYGVLTAARRRFAQMGYVFLLFTVAENAVLLAIPAQVRLGNGNVEPATWIEILAGQVPVMWFLYALIFAIALSALTVRVPAWGRLLLAIGLAFAASAIPIYGLSRAMGAWVFVLAGEWFGGELIAASSACRRIVAFPAACLLFGLVWGLSRPTQRGIADIIVLGLTGTIALVLLSSSLDGSILGHLLAWLGTASLGIYVCHIFVHPLVRLAWVRLTHSHAWAPLLVVDTLASTIFPALVYSYRVRLRLEWLFAPPGAKQIGTASRAPTGEPQTTGQLAQN